MIFGAIADDYTGGSDLAGMLAGQGVRTLMHFGVPDGRAVTGYDAAVVCLKSRSIAAPEARRLSAAALAWLEAAGARQIQFKYCSTFDSTAAGNIGPVLEELLDRTGAPLAVAVPALPVNGRTQYLGHLFVNGVLLAESPMRHHPLNPMTDSNLVRHLAAQTPMKVGLIPLQVVRAGALTIAAAAGELAGQGVRMALVDAIADCDLEAIARAVVNERLISGGSGLGAKLPAHWSLNPAPPHQREIDRSGSGVLLLAGSCSAATLAQLDRYQSECGPGLRVDQAALHSPASLAGQAAAAIKRNGRALVYSSAAPGQRMPPEFAGAIEQTLGALARELVRAGGIRRVIVAGGETAGAVVDALDVTAVEVLRVLSPGVPALATVQGEPLALVLKSGNFGSLDFFAEAAAYLESL